MRSPATSLSTAMLAAPAQSDLCAMCTLRVATDGQLRDVDAVRPTQFRGDALPAKRSSGLLVVADVPCGCTAHRRMDDCRRHACDRCKRYTRGAGCSSRDRHDVSRMDCAVAGEARNSDVRWGRVFRAVRRVERAAQRRVTRYSDAVRSVATGSRCETSMRRRRGHCPCRRTGRARPCGRSDPPGSRT